MRAHIVCLIFMMTTLAAAEVPDAETSGVGTLQSQTEPFVPGSYVLSAQHYLGLRGEIDPLTSITFSGSWKFRDWSFFLTQPTVKYYRINVGEEQLLFSDTIIGTMFALPSLAWDISHTVTFSSTLPISEFSRDHGQITRPRLSFSSARSFLDDRLTYVLTPTFQYHANRYRTTRTEDGANGGEPLRHYVWTIDQSLSYRLLPRLSLTAFVSYIQTFFHEVGYVNRGVSTANRGALLSENYSINLAANFSMTEQITISAGYDQSDAVERTYGVQEFYLLDTYNTQFFAGATVTF